MICSQVLGRFTLMLGLGTPLLTFGCRPVSKTGLESSVQTASLNKSQVEEKSIAEWVGDVQDYFKPGDAILFLEKDGRGVKYKRGYYTSVSAEGGSYYLNYLTYTDIDEFFVETKVGEQYFGRLYFESEGKIKISMPLKSNGKLTCLDSKIIEISNIESVEISKQGVPEPRNEANWMNYVRDVKKDIADESISVSQRGVRKLKVNFEDLVRESLARQGDYIRINHYEGDSTQQDKRRSRKTIGRLIASADECIFLDPMGSALTIRNEIEDSDVPKSGLEIGPFAIPSDRLTLKGEGDFGGLDDDIKRLEYERVKTLPPKAIRMNGLATQTVVIAYSTEGFRNIDTFLKVRKLLSQEGEWLGGQKTVVLFASGSALDSVDTDTYKKSLALIDELREKALMHGGDIIRVLGNERFSDESLSSLIGSFPMVVMKDGVLFVDGSLQWKHFTPDLLGKGEDYLQSKKKRNVIRQPIDRLDLSRVSAADVETYRLALEWLNIRVFEIINGGYWTDLLSVFEKPSGYSTELAKAPELIREQFGDMTPPHVSDAYSSDRTEGEYCPLLEEVLTVTGATHMVISETPSSRNVSCNGKLIRVDSEKLYGEGGVVIIDRLVKDGQLIQRFTGPRGNQISPVK